jgi:hypothetical protein
MSITFGRLTYRFTRDAALLDASWRFHLRRPRPHSVRGLERIELAARELADVSDRLQAAANALRESI